MICRHCNQRHASRPRGLCWPCYYRPGVKDQYPSTSKYAPKGPLDEYAGPEQPHGSPSSGLPGTEEKVQAMEQRALECRPLFHPQDAARSLAWDWLGK